MMDNSESICTRFFVNKKHNLGDVQQVFPEFIKNYCYSLANTNTRNVRLSSKNLQHI
jgi:hypothetical protein